MLMEMVRRGTLQIMPLLPGEADKVGAIMKRYGKMLFADAWAVRLSEMLPDSMVHAIDKRDSTPCRRHRNQDVKAVTP
jgi:hypothetical protein